MSSSQYAQLAKILNLPRRSFFLPPIILYAGLSVRKKAFFRNAPTISAMGILGTYVAFALIASILWMFSGLISLKLAVGENLNAISEKS